MQTNYRFSSQVFAKIFKNRMTEIHSTIHELATTYNLEPSSYCLFDSVFRQYNVKLNLEEFLTASTEKIQQNLVSQNVGTNLKNSTDLNLHPEFEQGGFSQSIEAFDLKMKLLQINSFICLRLVMKFQDSQQDLLTPSISKFSSCHTQNSYPS